MPMTNAWGCANRRRDELSRDPNRDFPYEQAPAILYLLYHTIPYYTILYHTIPYYTILYHTIPYYNILYHTIPYYTILYLLWPCSLTVSHRYMVLYS